MTDPIAAGTGGVYINVHVQPGARRPGVIGRHGNALKIAVAAQPTGGQANKAVINAVAELLSLPASDVGIVAGQTSRRKRLFAKNIDLETARSKIVAVL